MCNIIAMLIGGLFVGLAARWIYPGAVPMSLSHTIALGLAGSLLAGFASWWVGGATRAVQRAGCVASVVGALVLLYVLRHW